VVALLAAVCLVKSYRVWGKFTVLKALAKLLTFVHCTHSIMKKQ